jgi:hypothetical protein
MNLWDFLWKILWVIPSPRDFMGLPREIFSGYREIFSGYSQGNFLGNAQLKIAPFLMNFFSMKIVLNKLKIAPFNRAKIFLFKLIFSDF